ARDNVLNLIVEDNGSGLDSVAPTNGIGLSMTAQRLSELYGPAGLINLERVATGGSRVMVEIPLKRHSEAA
ncbi:MAG: hypothetical protein QOK07_2449, partial [Gemmatimonadaceae bacterium]|nr:hypothetical protein [Gemmatimonadaceae bacterium]